MFEIKYIIMYFTLFEKKLNYGTLVAKFRDVSNSEGKMSGTLQSNHKMFSLENEFHHLCNLVSALLECTGRIGLFP